MSPIPVLTPLQAHAWDRRAEAEGRPLRALMEHAGRAVAQLALERFSGAAGQGVLIACGPGHNGGDGWVAARMLHALGASVWVVESDPPRAPLTVDVRTAALADGVRALPADGPWPGVGVVIDALLGTGATGAPRAPMAALLRRIADLDRPIIAIDGPTGLDLGTGVSHGALPASLTITFGGARRGQLMARDEVGDLVVVDIGLPDAEPSWPRLVDGRWAARHLPPLPTRSHKGTRGRVVIVGGQEGMTGAARLAARAAFATGAGLVHVVAPAASVAVLGSAEPDVQLLPHDFEGPLSSALRELLERADTVVVGPGLGRSAGRRDFVLAILALCARGVVDADALVAVRDAHHELRALAAHRALVLTPHIGEFRTLFPTCSHALETDPWSAATEAQPLVGCTVLLKGVPTVIATTGGTVRTVAAGNPGLATGGSGDVLSGILGTLLSHLDDAPIAAAVAAQALGDAADHAARRTTARAMRPMDVVTSLPEVWRLWGRGAAAPRFPILAELPAPVQR